MKIHQEPQLASASAPSASGVRRLPRLDRAWVPAVTVLAAGVLLVSVRLSFLAHGDPTWFIGAGKQFIRRAGLRYPIHLFSGPGYDGRFFYRLALDPTQLTPKALGIELDSALRLQRIGYPVMAWLFAGGRGSLVPWSLIGVNLVSLALVGLVSGALARESGRHALAGLLLAAYWGYAFTLARDTAEIQTGALTLGALLALRRQRPWLAALAFTGAVLTRETSVLVVVAVALDQLVARRRAGAGSKKAGRGAYAAWILPGVAFVALQVVIHLVEGGFASGAGVAANIGPPLDALVRAVVSDLSGLAQPTSELDLLQLAVLAGIVVVAARALRESSAPTREKLAFVLMVLLALCLSPADLVNQNNQRILDELFFLAGLVLLGSERRLALPGALVAVLWLGVAVRVATAT